MSNDRSRKRWINLGEFIALLALIVSAIGVWIAWKSSNEDKLTKVVEQRATVALALRAVPDSDGRTLTIVPADPSHGLESVEVLIKGAAPIEVGSDGKLSSTDVKGALAGREKERKDLVLTVPIRIHARYVEAGTERSGGGTYNLRYKWQGGGIFGGRSLYLVGLSRG